ncbi:transglycosylase domain-containing protein [Pontibaca methylaminivorans]|uniref:peptidoglycan glycosyltransferase n=1 Tax=Pontibaca methylaminivorans TaxID=515897 RepID=A0A1R3WPX7_9RHOB|nr:PBP1A family penicillin-binding protein [Pontibaca methylaminivorans]SIT79990.1 penicillin-binding protein, 1A family [Pontibaca methylaminivorans]
MSNRSGKKPPLVADRRATGRKPAAGTTRRQPRRKTSSRRQGWFGFLKPGAPKPKKRSAGGGRGGGGPRSFIGGLLSFIAQVIWRLTWRVGVLLVVAIAIAVGYYYSTLPEVNRLLDGRARGSVTLLDDRGDVFAWRGDQFGGVVTTETVSPYLKNAIVATEDRRFYRHFGVSPRGIASAIRINLSEGRGALSGHGGSTLTQQTAKLLCFGKAFDATGGMTEREYESECRRSTIWRKIDEAIYAMAMEARYSKDQILTIYMNRAFLGAGARGFEAAAQRYFGKSASDVSPAEAAMLAGLLVAPSHFAPTNDLARAQRRANVIVGLMEQQGYLTAAEASEAREHPAQLSQAASDRAGGYFADWVMASGPEYFTRNTTEDVIIRTTLDRRVQKAAEAAMQHVFETKVREGSKAEAAIVVMSADGAVRAMVGGRETRVAGAFNRATQALRQTGSAFKPFVYAAALDLGHSPLATVVDEPYCLNIPGSGRWCPDNYTRNHYGRVTLTHALKDSLNVPAVKVSEDVGRDLVRKVATGFGIRSSLADGPALALGTSESTLVEMTGAFAGILNGGSAVMPYGVEELRLLGDDTPLMGKEGGIGKRVISEDAAEQLIWMMEKVISDGSGRRAAIPGWQAAGKTGTTQSARDAWFIGFTADYVAGVWMGNDDNKPLTGVTGGGLPAEIWRETMVRVHDGLEPRPLPMRAPPQPEPQYQQQYPQPGQPQAAAPERRGGGGLGQVVDQVLRDIFGG